jgi:hypothetical protein
LTILSVIIDKIKILNTWSTFKSSIIFTKILSKNNLLAISHVKNINIEIENALLIYSKSTIITLKFRAKISLVVAILRVEKINKLKM